MKRFSKNEINKIHVFKNKEKSEFKCIYDDKQTENYFNIPKGNRIFLIGSSGVGKTNFIQNLLHKRTIPFHKVYTITGQGKDSKEYDFVGKRLRKYDVLKPPALEKLKNKNNILIIDDVDISAQSKQFIDYLTKIFTFVSSHCGLLVILSTHSYSSIPLIIRRCGTIYNIFHSPDLAVIRSQIFAKHGARNHEIDYLYDQLKSNFDFLTIDLIPNTKSKYRLNNVKPIEISKKENKNLKKRDDE